MISVNKKELPQVKIFNDKSIVIGTCENELEFVDILMQIRKEKASGYTFDILKNNEPISVCNPIEKTGKIKINPFHIFNVFYK